MTDEVKEGLESLGTEEPKQTEPSEIERRALDMGWRPKEEFDGSEDDFIDAKEFVRRAPLFDKIESTSKEVKNLRKALDALKGHYTSVRESAVKEAIVKLEAARANAVSDGDGERFRQIDTQIKVAEQQMADIEKVKSEPVVEEPPQEFVDWTNRNRWYKNDEALTTYADAYGTKLHQKGLSPNEVLKKVEEAVKKEFPHKFQNQRKDSAPDVNAPNGRTTLQGKSKDSFELTEQERKIMNDLVRTKVLTKEEYIADLKKLKGQA